MCLMEAPEWLSQLRIQLLILAQVMISRFMIHEFKPCIRLCAGNGFCLPLSLCPSPSRAHLLSLSQKK